MRATHAMRLMPSVAMLSMAAISLAACAGSGGQDAATRAIPAQSLREASNCSTDLPAFRVTFVEGLYSPNGTMQTNNDGGWCSLVVAFEYGTPSRVDIVHPPQHGSLAVGGIKVGERLDYQPGPGFFGVDTFAVRAFVGGRTWTIPVAVSVTPAGPAGAVGQRHDLDPRDSGGQFIGGGGVGLRG